jgi:hypothetical protein
MFDWLAYLLLGTKPMASRQLFSVLSAATLACSAPSAKTCTPTKLLSVTVVL